MKELIKEAWQGFWGIAIFVGAIYLIENEGSNWIAETAGDVFGAIFLIFTGVYYALNEDN